MKFPVRGVHWAYRWLRPLWFHLPPETAHACNMHLLALIARCFNPPQLQVGRRCRIGGLHLPHRVGLAAGLDKTGRWVDALSRLGFAFMEVGAVTPRPQSGNLPPRLWRFPTHQALINRMGFNNEGAHRTRYYLERRRCSVPVGVNIGKNKDTPPGQAPADYAEVVRIVGDAADFFVVNVSSPNTPGLRRLQAAQALAPILDAVLAAIDNNLRSVPLWVKISPDLDIDALLAIARLCEQYPIDAVVATNTTVDFSGLSLSTHYNGGLSGAPLRAKARKVRNLLRQMLPPRVDVIASGGLITPHDVESAIEEGAAAAEVFTGLIYYGPSLVVESVEALSGKMR